jgi:hypothetical protein
MLIDPVAIAETSLSDGGDLPRLRLSSAYVYPLFSYSNSTQKAGLRDASVHVIMHVYDIFYNDGMIANETTVCSK